jgi:hypothetical protein
LDDLTRSDCVVIEFLWLNIEKANKYRRAATIAMGSTPAPGVAERAPRPAPYPSPIRAFHHFRGFPRGREKWRPRRARSPIQFSHPVIKNREKRSGIDAENSQRVIGKPEFKPLV